MSQDKAFHISVFSKEVSSLTFEREEHESEEATMSKETKTKGDADGGNTCPFTIVELKRIEGLFEMQFANEKDSAVYDGQIRCPLTGQRVCVCGTWLTSAKVVSRGVCFCACGPHLLCPEHSLNCLCYWDGDNPEDLDDLLLKWLKWRAGDFSPRTNREECEHELLLLV
jgi:hypothetical protein